MFIVITTMIIVMFFKTISMSQMFAIFTSAILTGCFAERVRWVKFLGFLVSVSGLMIHPPVPARKRQQVITNVCLMLVILLISSVLRRPGRDARTARPSSNHHVRVPVLHVLPPLWINPLYIDLDFCLQVWWHVHLHHLVELPRVLPTRSCHLVSEWPPEGIGCWVW